MDDDQTRRTIYICLTGHEIPNEDFDAVTEIQCLDAGAQVRLCREHGTVVAVRSIPQST